MIGKKTYDDLLLRDHHRLHPDLLVEAQNSLVHERTLKRGSEKERRLGFDLPGDNDNNRTFHSSRTHHTEDKTVESHTHGPNIQCL